MRKVTVTARLFDTCHSDYVLNWSGIVVGVGLAGQTVDEIADEVANDACYDSIEDESLLDLFTDADVRAAVVACIKPGSIFWPLDDHATEIHTTDLDDERLQQDQPCAWFRLYLDVEEIDED